MFAMRISTKLLFIISFSCLIYLSPKIIKGQTLSSCPNSDFSLGNFNDWVGYYGDFYNPAANQGFMTTRHTIITSPATFDPNTCGELPTICPGESYSARLGNSNVGAEAEQLRYTINVTTENSLFIYKYAVVMEDPKHDPNEQPSFTIEVADTNGQIIDPICGYYYVYAHQGMPSWHNCGDVVWKDWTVVGIDLTSYIGQTISIVFTTRDCEQSGHYGYAYLSAYCSKLQIVFGYCPNDTVATVIAPPGFSYLWSNGATTQSTIINNPVYGMADSCILTSANGCQVTIVGVFEPTIVTANFDYETVCLGLPVQFTDSSTINQNVITNWIWDFGDGSPLVYNIKNPQHTYTSLGPFNATLIAFSTEGCPDTITKSIVVIPPPDTYTINPTLPQCIGGNIELSLSHIGIEYILFLNNSTPIDTLYGTGSSISFGPQLIPGNYTIVAKDTATSCSQLMSGVSQIIIDPLSFDITPSGNNCNAVIIGLAGSETGINYTLYKNGVNTGIIIPGNGSQLSFGIQIPGRYTVIADNAALGCTSPMADTLVVSPPPTVYAGSDVKICADNSYTLSGQATNFSKVLWTTNGDGTFDNDSLLHAQYTPGTNDTTSKSVTLTFSVWGKDGCIGTSFSDQVILTFDPSPVAIAGQDGNVCTIGTYNLNGYARNHTNVSWSSSGDGYFNDNNSLNAIYTPGQNDGSHGSVILTLTARGMNSCIGNVSRDNLILTIDPLPIVNAGQNAFSCLNSPAYIQGFTSHSSSVLWTSRGDGTFNDPTLLNATYNSGPNDISSKTVELVLTGMGDATCTGFSVSDSMTLSIMDLPTALFGFNYPNCANDGIQFTDLSFTLYGNIRQWVWNFGDGTPNDTTNFPDEPNRVHHYSGGTYYVTLSIINSFECKHEYTIPVVVIPNPIANFYPYGNCEDNIVSFQNASFANGAGNIVGWNWNFGDPASGINNTSNLEDPTHMFASPGNYSVSLIITNFNNCHDTMTKIISIHALPEVDFANSIPCMGSPVYFIPDTSIVNINSINNWLWDFGDGITSNQKNSIHQYEIPGIYAVKLTINDTLGCVSEITHNVTVNPLPFAHFDAGINNCSGNIVTFSNYSSTQTGYIVSWFWDFGDGTTQTVLWPDNPSVTHAYLVDGTYNASLIVKSSDSCISSENQQLIIKPGPIVNFDFNSTTCFNSPVLFYDLTQLNGGGSIVGWLWNFGDPATAQSNTSTMQNPVHQFSSSGLFNVTLVVTLSNGCISQLQRPINISSAFPVDFAVNNKCQGAQAGFQPDLSIINPSIIVSWFWDFGDGSNSPNQSPNHIYLIPDNYLVTLTIIDTSGCSNTIKKTITINPEPVADFGNSTPACSNSNMLFNNLSFVTIGYITKWQWDFGDGSSQTISFPGSPDASHIYPTYGSYTVTLTITSNDSCTNSVSKLINILPNPFANFNHGSTCMGTPVQFNDLSQSGITSLTDWLWVFGDPASGANNVSTLQNPIHSFNAPVTYDVMLIVSNEIGCIDTISQPVILNALPAVDFSATPGCVNDSTHLISSTFVNSGTVTSRLWNFGDGFTSPEIDPYHKYTNSGAYVVTLFVNDTAGCENSRTKVVSISPPPEASFQTSLVGCANNPVFFHDISTSPDGQITSWYWDFGDGSDTIIYALTISDISHTFLSAGNYTVSLKIITSNGCEDVFNNGIIILPSPISEFIAENTCEYAPVNFTSQSIANNGTSLVSYLWNFGDPASGIENTSNLQNPIHIYTTAGTFSVLLLVTNADGCTDTTSHPINISPKPPLDFSWINTCIGTTTEFNVDAVVTNIPAVQHFDWDFGDGSPHSSQQDPFHTYIFANSYTVVLTITDIAGCINSKAYSIIINDQPIASFGYSSGCLDTPVLFTDQSFMQNGEPIDSWFWDFGVTNLINDTSSLQNPTWTFSTQGTYNVNLITTSLKGCQDTSQISININGTPEADYAFTPAYCKNGAVYFQDLSYSQQSSIVEWLWQFDATHYSTLPDPVYVFMASDSCYNVNLTVTDINGCKNNITKQVCVPAIPSLKIDYSPTCYQDSTYFSPQLFSSTGDSLVFFQWDFGDPESGIFNTSTLHTPSHYYNQPGKYLVSLEAIDIHNCSFQQNQYIVVDPLPNANFDYTSGSCDSTVYFIQSSTGNGSNILEWIWAYGDGKIDTVLSSSTSIFHKYDSPGIYQVNLNVINSNNCQEILTQNVFVNPCVKADIEVADTLVCQNNVISFVDSSNSAISITNWYWDFGDGTFKTYSSIINPVSHIYKEAGIFNVKMIITTSLDGNLVSDSTSIKVLVNPSPTSEFISKNACLGDVANFINTSLTNGVQITGYKWSFGDPTANSADTTSIIDPSHLYSSPGTYNVQLIATNILNCSDTLISPQQVNTNPTALFKNSLPCAGDIINFNDSSFSAEKQIISWKWTFRDSNGDLGNRDEENTSFTFSSPGRYVVNLEASDENGCIDTINKQLIVFDNPTSSFTHSENFNGTQGQLQFLNSSVNASRYYWDFGNGESSLSECPEVMYKNDGTYSITMVSWNAEGCSDTISMDYKFMVKGLYIPNAISPNNTHVEVRLFKPIGINLATYRIDVYDRWGNLLWYSEKLDEFGSPIEAWDGTYNGVYVQEGIYIWKASAMFKDGAKWTADDVNNGEPFPMSVFGTVTVIK